jgi:hypothetical protein
MIVTWGSRSGSGGVDDGTSGTASNGGGGGASVCAATLPARMVNATAVSVDRQGGEIAGAFT